MALTDTFVQQVKYSGAGAGDKHTDGQGMYLLVKATSKCWRFDYRFAEKRKTLAMGTYPDTSLAQARKRRESARAAVADGQDPGVLKKQTRLAAQLEAANTFKAVAALWLIKTAANRGANTTDKITSWLARDINPALGSMPIGNIKPMDVIALARKVEARGAFETTHRIVQICGQVFRFAVQQGFIERSPTVDLKGALAAIPKTNFAAITEPVPLGGLLRSIYAYQGHPVTNAALQLAPMVFVRPGELRTAEWAEIDLETAEWRIPGAKMKMKRDHLVPLCTQAVAVLRGLQPITGHGQYVFPSLRTGERPMSENTINACLRGMGYAQSVHTGHGFRATARTIMDEVLGERVDLIEHQLAHAVKDANGRAYNRTAHLPARREMMQRWADYLDKLRVGGEVIPLHKAA